MLAVGQFIEAVVGMLALTFLALCICLVFVSKSNSRKDGRLIRIASLTITVGGAVFTRMSFALGVPWQNCVLYGVVPFLAGFVALLRMRRPNYRKRLRGPLAHDFRVT